MATRDQRISARYILAVLNGDRQAPVSLRLDRYAEGSGKVGDDVVATSTDGVVGVEIVPWVSDIRWDKSPATRIRYPHGDVVVQRRGMRLRDVTLSGEVGPYPQRWPAVKANAVGPSFTSPIDSATWNTQTNLPEAIAESVERLERIDKLLDRVAEDSNLRLHLYATNEAAYWEVEPLRVTGSRIRSFKTGWTYAFAFRILRLVEPPDINCVVWAAKSYTETNPLKLAAAFVRKAKQAVEAVITAGREAAAWLHGETLGPILQIIDDVLDTGDELAALTDEVSDWLVGTVHLPVAIYNRCRIVGNSFRTTAQQLEWGLVDSWALSWGLGGGYGAASLDRLEDSGTMRDAFGAISAAVVAVSNAELALLLAADDADGRYGWAVVRDGDSLERLALRHLGDPERWSELQALNRLLYPYVTEARQPQTVIPGDQIRVPLGTTEAKRYIPEITSGPASVRRAKSARLGRDLSVTRRTDGLFDWALKRESTGESGLAGVALVEGVAAFQQNLTKRLETVRGTNPLFPSRGLPTAIGLLATADRLAAYTVAVTQELRGDDRVSEVRDLSFTTAGAETGFEATIGLVEGSDIPAPTSGV